MYGWKEMQKLYVFKIIQWMVTLLHLELGMLLTLKKFWMKLIGKLNFLMKLSSTYIRSYGKMNCLCQLNPILVWRRVGPLCIRLPSS